MNPSILQQMSLTFHCFFCSQVFQNAFCLINCGHKFCLKCFQEKIQVTQREGDVVVAKCTCNMSTCCLESAKEELREPVVETLIQILGKDKIPSNKQLCGSESECGREALYWCPNCETNLCQVCFDHHGKTHIIRRHHGQVMKLDQKKKDGKAPCSRCQVATSTFCETCQQIVCVGECWIRFHNGHQFSDLVTKVQEKKEQFGKFINEVQGHLQQTQIKCKKIEEEIGRLQFLLKEERKRENLVQDHPRQLELGPKRLGG
eukprot:TRINITY_DN471_c1_g2_i4.p1 TRINITY_DN471_c1_g2~~TRINITY_DN471_c1_g2_i4.p1  ORF type:complete len:260 (-),score=78.70 TRINITY_DN471_c1_g2_i4:140-919(-)